MDVISSHQAGVKEAVATSGTAMTELHLKTLSRLTNDIRLAYDGDAAGVKAAERSVMLAGKLGISLAVISGYGTAKDPDELIQQGAEKWRACVEEREPAVDWLLKKYEETLDLSTGPGKKEYSDVAMQVIGYLQDPVERKHYEQVVAKRLDVTVEDLQAKKIPAEGGRRKRMVRTKSGVKDGAGSDEAMRVLEDNLQAILLYGGVTGKGIELELPEEEMRLDELELVFEQRYGGWETVALEKEAGELWRRYEQEEKKRKIEELSTELLTADEERTRAILREIQSLQKKG